MTTDDDEEGRTMIGVISVHIAPDSTGKFVPYEPKARWSPLAVASVASAYDYARRYPNHWPKPQYTLVGFYEPTRITDEWMLLFNRHGDAFEVMYVDGGDTIIPIPRMFDAATGLPLYFLHGRILTLPVT